MSRFAFQRTAVDGEGNVLPDAQVDVRDSSGSLVDLEDRDGNALNNPINADSEGFFRFYVVIGKYNIKVSGNGQEIEWVDVQIGVPDDRPLIRTPEITAPTDLQIGVSVNMQVTGTPYASLYSADERAARRFQVVESSGEFTNPDFEEVINADSVEIGPLNPVTEYLARIRDESVEGDVSPWSPVIQFTTSEQFIIKPVNLLPIDEAVGQSLTPELTASAFETNDEPDAHASSLWKVYDAASGLEVYTSGLTTTYLTSHTVTDELGKATTYEWDVIYFGASLGQSQPSDRTGFTTTDAEIQAPVVTVEGEPDNVPETPLIEGGAFTMVSGLDAHQSTDWRVTDVAADEVVFESLSDTQNLESIQLPSGVLDEDTDYEFAARYNGELVSSEFGAKTATTVDVFPGQVPLLAVAHSSTPYITIYDQQIDTFTKLPNPSVLPTNVGRSVAFSSDDTYMSVGHSFPPYIAIYKRSGDTFTKLPDPSVLPSNVGRGVAFSNTGFPQI